MSGPLPGGARVRLGRFLGTGATLGLLLAAGTVRAASPEPPLGRFRHLTTADGLSEPRVRAVLQDRVGFLWVGTADGLGRYDGARFRTFRHDPSDPGSLGPGMVIALLEDRRGRLWAGHFGGGLSCFDPSTERFRRFQHDPADPHSLSQNDAADLLEDGAGALWVATNGGLNRLDPDTGVFTRFLHDAADPESLSGNDVRSLAQDPSGALWVGTGDGGLDRLTMDSPGGRAHFQRWRHDPRDARSLPSDNVESVLVDHESRLWVGTWDAGLVRYDPDRNAFLRPTRRGAGTKKKIEWIQDLLEDHHGMIWVATWGAGVVRIDPTTGRETRYPAEPDEPASLSHGNVAALFEDKSGLLWIGTGGGGLNALDLTGQPFRRIGLKGAGVRDARSVVEDRAGRLWVGTAGGGLLQLDRSGSVVRRYRHADGDPGSLADDNVFSLLEDREGSFWVGTLKGLDRFDRASGRFVHHRHDPARADSLSNDIVVSLFEDRSGRLWAGTENGLDLLDRARGHFVHHRRAPGSAGEREADSVLGMAEGSAGDLWVALRGGLAHLDHPEGILVPVPLLTDGVDDKSSIWCIRRAETGALWVGKGSALYELRPSARSGGVPESRRHLPDPEGGLVTSIESDASGKIWVGTTRGLVRYDPVREHARRYDAEDEALREGFNLGAVFRSARGELCFGTTGGLTVVRPEAIHDDSPPPPVVLTDLRVAHKPVPVGSPLLPLALSLTKELRLPQHERVFTFEFAALGFRSPRANRYRYQLEGFDPGWNDLPPDRNEVTYTNLSPGRYVLRVAAANGEGAWTDQGASLALEVLPPFWATWWFRLLTVLAVTAGLMGAHRARLWAVEAANRRLEREVQERRQAQDSLERSERQLRLLADALPVLIAYVDQHHRLVFSNLASERWFGRPRAEIEGRLVEEVLPAELLSVVGAPLAHALAGQGASVEAEVGALGSKRRIAATLVPHSDGSGSFPGVYALVQDITERARSEEAFRRQLEQLAHASRVLTLGELAAAIAHEVNQPLTAILSTAQAALRLHAPSDAKGDDVGNALSDIAASARRGGDIVWKLQDLVRKGSSKREGLDVNAAIRGLEPLLHAGAMESDVRIELDLEPDLRPVEGDSDPDPASGPESRPKCLRRDEAGAPRRAASAHPHTATGRRGRGRSIGRRAPGR